MTKKQKAKLAIIRQYIDEHGKLINKRNGSKLALDPNVSKLEVFSRREEINEWWGSTIDVMTYSEHGIGYLYYHNGRNIWYVKGFAPFDVPYNKEKQNIASKFITIEQYNSITY